jgi:hypothetical protein
VLMKSLCRQKERERECVCVCVHVPACLSQLLDWLPNFFKTRYECYATATGKLFRLGLGCYCHIYWGAEVMIGYRSWKNMHIFKAIFL